MSLSFRESYVARPSVAPTNSAGAGTLSIGHRRINQLGQRSAPSPILTSTSLPGTLTPQSYADTDALLRDEFIVSNDGGTTWKIIPSDSDHIGPLVVSTGYDSGWVTTTTTANQSTTVFNLDFEDFNSTTEPIQTVYLVNVGTNSRSLTFNFVDLITQQPLTQLAGKIQVEILGLYPALGASPDNDFNQSFIWDVPPISLNTVSILFPAFNFLKLRIKLLNYPIGGLSQEAFNISMTVVSNQTAFPLTYPNQWPDGTFLIDDDTPFTLPIIEEIDATNFQVNPFMVNQGGILRTQLREVSSTVTNGNRVITFSPSGTIGNYASGDTIPDDHIVLATATFTAGVISNLVHPWPIKPQAFANLGSTSTQDRGRFVKLNSDGTVGLATTSDGLAGISLFDDQTLVACQGLAFLQVGEAVDVGDLISPGTLGKGFIASSGHVGIALESGSTDQYVKVLISPQPSSSATVAWGEITGTLSDQTDLDTALDGKQPLATNLTTVAAWTADQTTRAGALPSTASGTIEKTAANTFGTYTVTPAAKTVLDDLSVGAMLTTLGGAPLASPTFTGTPAAPTAASGTNTTQIATTAFVNTRNLSPQLAEWALSSYGIALTTGVNVTPTLVSPTVYTGSGFSTAGFTVPSGQAGLYYVEVYGEIVGSGYNLEYGLIGLKKNSTDFFRRQQINFNNTAQALAFIQTLSTMVFLSVGDTIRPQFEAAFLSGTASVGQISFLVHKMPSY